MTATEIAAGQGDLSDREFLKVLQDSIEETQRTLDLALKDMQPSLNRSPKRMLELLKRPTHNYEAAACAENHRQLLRAAALALNNPSTTTTAQDIQALLPASGPTKKTKSANRLATTTKHRQGRNSPLQARSVTALPALRQRTLQVLERRRSGRRPPPRRRGNLNLEHLPRRIEESPGENRLPPRSSAPVCAWKMIMEKTEGDDGQQVSSLIDWDAETSDSLRTFTKAADRNVY